MVFVYTAIAGSYPIVRKDIPCFNGEGVFTRPEMDAKRALVDLPHQLRAVDPVILPAKGRVVGTPLHLPRRLP